MTQPQIKAPPLSVRRYGPGEEVTDPQPGDFILTHNSTWSAKLVQFGQKLRYRGADSRYARWNHTALIVDNQGSIIEAIGRGISQTHLSDYKPTEYYVVHIDASDEDRQEVVAFARACLGESYGWLTLVSIALSLLSGAKFSFGLDGQQICSGLVARSLERTNAIFLPDTSHITPAFLAKYYQVEPPPPDTPIKSAAKRDGQVSIAV